MAIPGPRLGQRSFNYVWDSSVFSWSVMAQPAVATSTQVAISSVGGVVVISGNSTVIQGTSPWVTSVSGFPSGLLSSAAPAAGSSGLIVRQVGYSTVVSVSKSGQTPGSPVGSTLSSVSAQILASNANRTGLVITNLSSGLVFLGLSTAAVVNKGIALYPGGTWTMDDFTFTTGAVNGLGVNSSSPLAVQEFS